MSMFTNEDVVTGAVDVNNFPAVQPVSGPVTDTELRATPVPVTIPTPVPVTDNAGSLTVDGTVSITGSVAVTGPLTDAELRATPVPISGSVSTTPLVSNSSTVTQVTSTGANQTLLAANASRRAAIFLFESGIWSLKLGATASTSSKTYAISASNTLIEIPEIYQGRIDAICTTANKLVDVTELS